MIKTKKHFTFTIDDNIRFFRELMEGDFASLFAHPYLALLQKMHTQFNVKVQLNCFLEDMQTFNLSMMSNRYKAEWEENSDWLKLSFHSKKEFPIEPYKQANYAEMYDDCIAVHKEIERFAGVKSLAKTTTVHYCLATEGAVQALKDCRVKGLLGLYGTTSDENLLYQLTDVQAKRIADGEIVYQDGIAYAGIDVILNLYPQEEILSRLQALLSRDMIKIMIHEQYFYSDYSYYQKDFEEKLEKTFQYLTDNGFEGAFYEDVF